MSSPTILALVRYILRLLTEFGVVSGYYQGKVVFSSSGLHNSEEMRGFLKFPIKEFQGCYTRMALTHIPNPVPTSGISVTSLAITTMQAQVCGADSRYYLYK